MSQENVDALERAVEAFNRRDVDAVLEELDPEVEWRPLFQVLLGGEATIYWGREGYRDFIRDVFEVFDEIRGMTKDQRVSRLRGHPSSCRRSGGRRRMQPNRRETHASRRSGRSLTGRRLHRWYGQGARRRSS
jgi:SnoaL-like domain